MCPNSSWLVEKHIKKKKKFNASNGNVVIVAAVCGIVRRAAQLNASCHADAVESRKDGNGRATDDDFFVGIVISGFMICLY